MEIEAVSFATLLLVFLGGCAAALSPCMLPALPGLLSVIGSVERQSDGTLRKSQYWFRTALSFVLGLGIGFTLIGAGAGLAVGFIAPKLDLIQQLLGILLVGAGMTVLLLDTGFAAKIPVLRALLQERNAAHRVARQTKGMSRMFRAFAIGLGFGLAWIPCIGPILAAVAGFAMTSQSVMGATLLLAVFAAGIGTVFLAFAAGAAALIAKFGRFARVVNIISGIVLIALGAMFLFGFTDEIKAFIEKWPGLDWLFK